MKRVSQLRASAPVRNDVANASPLILIVGLTIALLVCAAIFFSYRQQDVGRLPILMGDFLSAFGREPIMGWTALGGSLMSLLIAVLIVLSWFGLGTIAIRLIAPETNAYALNVSWQLAIGASLWSLLWFALGTASLYRKPVAIVALLVGLGLGIWAIAKSWQEKGWVSREQSQASWLRRTGFVLLAFPLLMGLIAALAEPTGKDALVYRLAVPKAYLAAGGIVDVTTNVYSFLAFGAEMNGVWAMLLGSFVNPNVAESAFGAVAFAYLPVLLLATYGLARDWQLRREWAFIAAFLVATIPSFYQVAANGYVDHSLALYIILAVHAAGKWWATEQRANLICLAFALGSALAIKFIALFAFFPLFVIVLFKARAAQKMNAQAANALLLNGLGAIVLAGLLASPWYIRTWVRTGSPVYPFYAHLWNGSSPNWDADRSRLFQMWVARYGGEQKNIVDYLAAPLKLSFQAQPEFPANYDGVIGIAILLGLPLLVWGTRRLILSEEIKIALAVAGGWYLCWLFTSEQLRFLLPALPLLIVAIVLVSSQLAIAQNLLQWMWITSALPGLLVICAWFLEQNPLRVVMGGEPREDYLTRRLDHYPYYKVINQDLPNTARVWLINMRNDTVHLERDYFADYVFEDYTIMKLVQQATDLSDLRTRVKAMGITHILVRHDVLLDYQRTPIVDERKSEAENQAKLQMLKSFLTEGPKVLKSDTKFMLVQL